MKKIFFLLATVIIAVGAHAQQGYQAVGANINIAPCLESDASLTNFGIGARYQYGLTDNVRLEADIDYLFKAKGLSQFDIIANAQYVAEVSPKFNVYPLVGIGFASIKGSWSIDLGDYSEYFSDYKFSGSETVSKFLFNIGAGAEYQLTENLKGFFELKYQYCNGFAKLPISLGVTYSF